MAPDSTAEIKKKVCLSWSGGKDAAMALHALRQDGASEVVSLLTSVTEGYDRISMHGVREQLLEQQATALDLPLTTVRIPKRCGNEQYVRAMKQACEQMRASGISHVAFGDLFLQDVREYRERNLSEVGLEAAFPLWQHNTRLLADEFIALGFKAIIACVNSQLLDGVFVGRAFDEQLMRDLPSSVDPCGENGEFHSFVYDGPLFTRPVPFEKGEIVLREKRFWYCDLLPLSAV